MPVVSTTAQIYKRPSETVSDGLYFSNPLCLTATAAFAAAAAAITFFRFEYEFPQKEEYASEHNHADDNILSHNDCIHLVVW